RPSASNEGHHPAHWQPGHLDVEDHLAGERDRAQRSALFGAGDLFEQLSGHPAPAGSKHLVPHHGLRAHLLPGKAGSALRQGLHPQESTQDDAEEESSTVLSAVQTASMTWQAQQAQGAPTRPAARARWWKSSRSRSLSVTTRCCTTCP